MLSVFLGTEWFGVGCVVRDVCGTVVYVLDLRVQGSMAHQVSFPHSEPTSVPLRLGIGLITPLATVLPTLGASSIVRILPYAAYICTYAVYHSQRSAP